MDSTASSSNDRIEMVLEFSSESSLMVSEEQSDERGKILRGWYVVDRQEVMVCASASCVIAKGSACRFMGRFEIEFEFETC